MEQSRSQRRFVLRAATAEAHRALENELGAIGSREDYVRYLRAMAMFRGAIESRVAGSAPGQFRPTTLHDCLTLDCEDLSVTGIAPLSTSIDGSGEAGLGVAYVLEGSTLGAALLFRSAQRLGFDGAFGARHLSRQVERRAHWTAFLAYLEEQPSLDMAKIVEAANATFQFARAAAREASHAS